MDTVELVMEVEEKFDVTIADIEVEEITLVSDFSEVLIKKLQLFTNQNCLSQKIFYKIKKSLGAIGVDQDSIKPESKIKDLLQNHDIEHVWKKLAELTGLKFPNLVELDINRNLKREITLFGIIIKHRVSPMTDNTIHKIVDWVISLNHEVLVDPKRLSNRYEIDRIICGIISDSHGIPVNEIELHHAITNDLGLD